MSHQDDGDREADELRASIDAGERPFPAQPGLLARMRLWWRRGQAEHDTLVRAQQMEQPGIDYIGPRRTGQ